MREEREGQDEIQRKKMRWQILFETNLEEAIDCPWFTEVGGVEGVENHEINTPDQDSAQRVDEGAVDGRQ